MYYHPFLPLIDNDKTLHDYYEISHLLFWSIVSVSCRRLTSHPTLLQRLARSVSDLLWRQIRSVPHSLPVVQAVCILCTWPFPTNSSTTDPTFLLSGIMLQVGVQMGLHRATEAQDFSRNPLKLNAAELHEWERMWDVCQIVAQR
jgi:hypothetical protein